MKKIFVNLSNHPSKRWGEDQKKATFLMADGILDLPFPQVSPEASIEEVQEIAHELLHRIWEITWAGQKNAPVAEEDGSEYGPNKVIVHAMGEMTLVYSVVTLLKSYSITCVASTSKREVQEVIKEDGSTEKKVIFKFIRFRKY